MGKPRPPERNKRKKSTPNGKNATSPAQLLADAQRLLQCGESKTGEPRQEALKLALKALKTLRRTANSIELLPALTVLGEISVELGDASQARAYFSEAAEIDEEGSIPEERGGGPEKYFWLAQLSEEGGLDSVKCYEKGADVLRKQIALAISRNQNDDDVDPVLDEARLKLASALCGIAEIYMTDLSFDDAAAEEQCDKAILEALSVAPDSPQTLQTAASVRISQLRKGEAREFLKSSLELWKDLDVEDPAVPDFATRISLSRLLMEAELEDESIDVLERLVREDDQSVEAWYLGGWCLQLLSQKEKDEEPTNGHAKEEELLRRSRTWLLQALDLHNRLDYEDERLRDHAQELVNGLNELLGDPEADEAAEDDEEDWEDDDEAEDEEMDEG